MSLLLFFKADLQMTICRVVHWNQFHIFYPVALNHSYPASLPNAAMCLSASIQIRPSHPDWSHSDRQCKDTRHAAAVLTVLSHQRTRRAIWHLSNTGRIPLWPPLFSCQLNSLWEDERISRTAARAPHRAPWPLSRIYYHLLDVSVGLESHFYR